MAVKCGCGFCTCTIEAPPKETTVVNVSAGSTSVIDVTSTTRGSNVNYCSDSCRKGCGSVRACECGHAECMP